MATLKDDYSVSNIIFLVDSTTSRAMYSFMDGYFVYNWIQLAPQDQTSWNFVYYPKEYFLPHHQAFQFEEYQCNLLGAMLAIFYD